MKPATRKDGLQQLVAHVGPITEDTEETQELFVRLMSVVRYEEQWPQPPEVTHYQRDRVRDFLDQFYGPAH